MKDGFNMEKIAFLAALQLSGETRKELETDMGRILAMVEKLRAANLPEGTQPLRHTMEIGQRTRADESNSAKEETREQVMEQAPEALSGLFLVPKVLD